jgi:predicted phage-related endonuclease
MTEMAIAHAPDWHAQRREGIGGSDAVLVPEDHAAFVAYRQSLQGIGASDAASVLGLSRFQSAFELWARLTGRIPADAGNKRTQRGLRLEPVAAEWYAEETGRKVRRIRRTARDPRWPHLFAHPDRATAGRLIQIKTGWRDYPDGRVPLDVQAQVTVEAALTHRPVVDVALMTFEDLYIHEVRPDPTEAAELCDFLEEWYQRHVLADDPPRDGSRAYSRFLDAHVREVEEQGTEAQDQLMGQLRAVRGEQRRLEADENALVIALKESMAGATRVAGDGWRITWTTTKPRRTTDWREIATDYRSRLGPTVPEADLEAVVEAHTSEGEPGRQFRPTWKEEDE